VAAFGSRLATVALSATLIAGAARADDWPQWLGPQRDAVWRETGIVKSFPAEGLPKRWRVEVGGGYAGPAVAQGRVYLMDRILAPTNSLPASGFAKAKLQGQERVLCVNEADGKLLWVRAYDCPYDVMYPAGPRVTPAVGGGKVYTLGTMGDLYCLDAATGAVLWSHDFKSDYGIEPPVWGFSGHPLIDGSRMICLARGAGTTAVAFDKNTGKEVWRALSAKEPGYAPPMIFEAGGKRQLIIWHPEAINSLNPETGEVYWSEPFTAKQGMSISTPRRDGDQLFFTCFYNGSIMLKLDESKPAASVVWRRSGKNEQNTDALHSVMSTPVLENGYIYGVCSYGQLRALRADNGDRVWETLAATVDGKEARWGNAFIVKNGDRYFLCNEKGDLIIAELNPAGYHEISRTHLLEPTNIAAGRPLVWSHPAFADRCVFARNDKELICVSLADTGSAK